jgi:hypothetical protein
MRNKWVLVLVIFVAVIGLTLLFTDNLPNITGAGANLDEPVDLNTFDYASVVDREDFPKVNVTGVIDNICMLPGLPLWSKAGAGNAGGEIAITVRGCPGTEMRVVEIQDHEGTTWYRVQKNENRDGLQMWWEGWVTEKVIIRGPLPIPVES